MPVRSLLTEGDKIEWSKGAFTAASAKTYAALIKLAEGTEAQRSIFFSLTAKEGSSIEGANVSSGAVPHLNYYRGAYLQSSLQPPIGKWVLCVWRKANESSKALLSVYDFSTGKWSHEETSTAGTMPATAPGGFSTSLSGIIPHASYAAVFAAKRVLSLAEVESLATATELADWSALKPDGMWFFNQSNVEEPVQDQTAGEANQVARVGTKVVEEEPPIPYSEVEEIVIGAPPATATASSPGAEVAVGAMPSPTDHKRGLPLPFPSILANPGRVGPSRFSAADRKTLGLD